MFGSFLFQEDYAKNELYEVQDEHLEVAD